MKRYKLMFVEAFESELDSEGCVYLTVSENGDPEFLDLYGEIDLRIGGRPTVRCLKTLTSK
jgi:hypothetical protein